MGPLTVALLAIVFREHTIATDLKGGYQVVVADMNRDGRPDLIALASGMPELVWYENPGWTRHVIARGMSRMINVAPHDVDGDGIPELILASEFANEAKKSTGIVSVLQHKGDPRQPWEIREIDKLTTSHRLRWADFTGSGRKVAVNAPLTGARAEAPKYDDRAPLAFYDPMDWKRQMIGDENRGVVHGILIYDWNADGRDDVMTASFSGIHVHSLNRNGQWQRTEITKEESSDIAVGFAGEDRFIAAIEPWHGNRIAVHKFGSREVIETELQDGHTILTADFDKDGQDEIVAGCRGGPRSVFLYRHEGDKWVRQTVGTGIAAAACAAADLNGDGRPDIACIGSATTNLRWYEQISTPGQ